MLPLPHTELARSPASLAIGRWAAASHLSFAHFEHQVTLPLPDAWEPIGRPDLGEISGWRGGVLPETKFRHFRLDRMIASYHPGQRARWASHELCHRLVGFGWRPGASRLWLATMARLAEALPVALWYFFDEAGARRCPAHTRQGLRFERPCPACEALALTGCGPADTPDALAWIAEGRAFWARERDAALEGLRCGWPVSSPWATLDLCTDGLAWASAHGPRLEAPAFQRWVSQFSSSTLGLHDTLDSLIARVEAMIDALYTPDAAPPPWEAGGFDAWAVQDVAARLLQIQALTEGEAARELDVLIDHLAGTKDLARCVRAYEGMTEEWELPSVEEAFAVGYPLAGTRVGRSVTQVREGLTSACPQAMKMVKRQAEADALGDLVGAFVEQDPLVRQPIGRRFARFLAARLTPEHPIAELAAIEAGITHCAPPDTSALALSGQPARDGRYRLSPGVELHLARFRWEAHLDPRASRQRLPYPPARLLTPTTLALVRSAAGEVELLALSPEAAAWCAALPPEGASLAHLPPEEQEALRATGLVCPCAVEG